MPKKNKKLIQRRKNLHIIIELLGVIAIWRGFWGISDIFLFPENQLFSYMFSITFGLVLLIIDNKGLGEFK